MSISTFNDNPDRFSPFIRFAEHKGFVFSGSADADDAEAVAPEATEAPKIPQLSYLRVELDRLRPGMGDYIIRVSSPLYEGVENSNTVLSIRGTRGLAKYDHVKKLAALIGKEMLEKGDVTHKWESLDVEHLADLLAASFKFFSIATNTDRLQFTTEALS